MLHELKTLPCFFEKVVSKEKTFEIRENDRDYAIGDYLLLREWMPEGYSGREVLVKVIYLYEGGFFKSGYCAMSIDVIDCWNVPGRGEIEDQP